MKVLLGLLLALSTQTYAADTQIVNADGIQISTGGPLINPINSGVLNLRTAESAVLFSAPTDANSIYLQTGAVTVEAGVSGMIRAITGPVADGLSDGYTGNAEMGTSAGKGDGYSGDVILSGGVNADVADNSGRVRFSAIRTMVESGYFQLYKDANPPAGPTVEAGDMYYDTDDNKVKVYNGSQWKTLAYE